MNDETKSTPANGEPTASRSAVPVWIVVLLLTILFVGAVYFDSHGGWFNSKVYGPYASPEQVQAHQPGTLSAAASGKLVYESICGACHGVDGLGKPGQAPPLAGSEWVNTKGVARLIHIPQAGLNGPLQVEGKDWNLSMAPVGVVLSDTALAEVLTYIRSAWGNKGDEVTADDVKTVRTAMGAQSRPLNSDQLKAMSE